MNSIGNGIEVWSSSAHLSLSWNWSRVEHLTRPDFPKRMSFLSSLHWPSHNHGWRISAPSEYALKFSAGALNGFCAWGCSWRKPCTGDLWILTTWFWASQNQFPNFSFAFPIGLCWGLNVAPCAPQKDVEVLTLVPVSVTLFRNSHSRCKLRWGC